MDRISDVESQRNAELEKLKTSRTNNNVETNIELKEFRKIPTPI